MAGSVDGDQAHIKLSGDNILVRHCAFSNDDGNVTIEAMPGARTFVNGKRVPPNTSVKLLSGYRIILGDFHVFRYNDPSAIRAQRQKMRGSESFRSLSAVDLPGNRSESPAARADVEYMDWSAARREVADIEKLGDQDLDRLFDDIIKVRNQRNRPDSRPDLATEYESRLMTSSYTEDSLDRYSIPWTGPQETTITSSSIHTPLVAEADKEIMPTSSGSCESNTSVPDISINPQAQEAARRKEQLEQQVKEMARELKLAKSQAATARALERTAFGPVTWSAQELRLVQTAVRRWRRLRSFAMAEQVLTEAVNVREANVFA